MVLHRGAPAAVVLALLLVPVGLAAGGAGTGAPRTAERPSAAPAQLAWLPVADDEPLGGAGGAGAAATLPGETEVLVSLPFSNQSALSALLAAETDPLSPDYHHYLSAAAFDAEFGGAPAAYDEVLAYFRAADVRRIATFADRATITFEASLSTVDALFHTSVGVYRSGPLEYYAASSAPELPSAIAPFVSAVEGLSNYSASLAAYDLEVKEANPSAAAAPAPPSTPAACSSNGGAFSCTTVDGVSYPTPVSYGGAQMIFGSDLQVAYNTSALYAADGYPTDQTVATILWSDPIGTTSGYGSYCQSLASGYSGDYAWDYYLPDVLSYYNSTLPAGEPHAHVVPVALASGSKGYAYPSGSLGKSASCDDDEANIETALDLEMIGSLAPGSTIYQVFGESGAATTTDGAFAEILNPSASGLSATDGSDSSANVNGLKNVSVISNSWGGTDANDTSWYHDLEEAEARGITVLSASGDSGDDPQTSWVVGDVFAPASASFDAFGDVAVGGTTLTLSPTTLSITADAAWYDRPEHVGSSGGVSSVFAMPDWQASSSDADSVIRAVGDGRGVPDLGAIANNTPISVTYAGTTYNVTAWASGSGLYVSGTSIACPTEAGVVATINHALGREGDADVGFLDPTIYAAGQQEATSGAGSNRPLIDVVSGANDAYPALKGYDLVTGWGSISGSNFTELYPGPRSALTFTETGLPSGTSWSVSVSGVGTNSTLAPGAIGFAVASGSYSYSIASISGYTSTGSGGVTVGSGGASVTVAFAPFEASVTFRESGLPNGALWYVNLTGHASLSSAPISGASGTTLSTELANGSYGYGVATNEKNFSTTASGTFGESGSSSTLDLAFAAVDYAVSFLESGLPNGAVWYVNVSGRAPLSSAPISGSTGTTISTELSNGTFPYLVSVNEKNLSTASVGALTVDGAPISPRFAFAPVDFSVAFEESGLPAGAVWYVNLTGGASAAATVGAPGGTVLSFELSNGTVGYGAASNLPTWSTPSPANLVVAGRSTTVSVPFLLAPYRATFLATGLASGVTWQATIGEHTVSSRTAEIAIVGLLNGSYAFSVGAISGYSVSPRSGTIDIAGQSVSVSVLFERLLYAVSFSEAGLPSGTTWAVSLGGSLEGTSGSTLSFEEGNGTYPFLVAGVAGYALSGPAAGVVTVTGPEPGPVAALVFALKTYPVVFTEQGAEVGVGWGISLSGPCGSACLANTSAPELLFAEPNGSYAYSVSSPAGWVASQGAGAFTVDGVGVDLPVPFVPRTVPITFQESGLLNGSIWGVDLAGDLRVTSTSSITYLEPNGSGLLYTVFGPPGYSMASDASGALVASGAGLEVPVSFSPLPTQYLVVFTESGLPTSTAWGVSLGGGCEARCSVVSTSNTLDFLVPNGTYPYAIAGVGGFHAAVWAGSLTVSGRTLSLGVDYTPTTYAVRFTESGLAGATWGIAANDTNASAFLTTSSATLTLDLANGTWNFSVAAPTGYLGSPGSGRFTVAAGPVNLSITFHAVPQPRGPSARPGAVAVGPPASSPPAIGPRPTISAPFLQGLVLSASVRGAGPDGFLP